MKINRKLTDKAILEIKKLQQKYCKQETMFIYHGLDTALKEIGWAYAKLLGGEHEEISKSSGTA
jgi:hypothetical protein